MRVNWFSGKDLEEEVVPGGVLKGAGEGSKQGVNMSTCEGWVVDPGGRGRRERDRTSSFFREYLRVREEEEDLVWSPGVSAGREK